MKHVEQNELFNKTKNVKYLNDNELVLQAKYAFSALRELVNDFNYLINEVPSFQKYVQSFVDGSEFTEIRTGQLFLESTSNIDKTALQKVVKLLETKETLQECRSMFVDIVKELHSRGKVKEAFFLEQSLEKLSNNTFNNITMKGGET